MKRTAAIYARVSSDRQKEEQTIGSQIATLLEMARSRGYVVPAEWIFRDEGYSGATLARPALESVRDLAVEGQLQNILIHSPDRLSRKYAYQVLLLEEFSRHGVEVIFLKSPEASTPEQKLLLQLQGMIAEYERAQIAERSRRGKRYRARGGVVSVLSGAPYGYRYVKKTDLCSAYYELIEEEARVVRDVYRLYTEEGLSLMQITKRLMAMGIPTRKGNRRWKHCTVRAILRNPAYKGTACFGKTERAERRKITRRLRLRGGFSPRCSSSRERPRSEWIEIAVPAIVTEEGFALAQERLMMNKQFSPRHTKEASILQGLLVCKVCGYAYYRARVRSGQRKIYYYRCSGSNPRICAAGRVCANRPVRQDYLDELVWKHIIELLSNPRLVKEEIERRALEARNSNPTRMRKEVLVKEISRMEKATGRLIDAYQEGLLELGEFRNRIGELRKRESASRSQMQSLDAMVAEQETCLQLVHGMEGFLKQMKDSAETLDVLERQKIVRSVAREILVGPDTLTIKHSIPITNPGTGVQGPLDTSKDIHMPGYKLRICRPRTQPSPETIRDHLRRPTASC